MGVGIVLELQKQAIDENTSLEELLRKAFLVSRKLKLNEFENWIRQEQNGYSGKVPDYRILNGEMKAWNPVRGVWIPIVSEAEISKMISKMPFGMSIASIIDAYNSADGVLVLSVNGELSEAMNKLFDEIPTKYSFHVFKSELYRIISTVRNKILDWSLILEENGILGEDMTFTEKELNAANASSIVNYTNNFYGNVTGIDFLQG